MDLSALSGLGHGEIDLDRGDVPRREGHKIPEALGLLSGSWGGADGGDWRRWEPRWREPEPEQEAGEDEAGEQEEEDVRMQEQEEEGERGQEGEQELEDEGEQVGGEELGGEELGGEEVGGEMEGVEQGGDEVWNMEQARLGRLLADLEEEADREAEGTTVDISEVDVSLDE